MATSTCDALVVCCIDFRFQEYIRTWTDTHLAGNTFDLVGYAGATKELDTIMDQVDISVRLHTIERIVLIHHEDCGAYGTESTPMRHAKDLNVAYTQIKSRYPSVDILLLYAKLDGTFDTIATA